jgi:hypothetical protein
MQDDEDNGDETQTRKLTEGQKKVLRRARRIHRSLVRPAGDGPAPGSFPSVDDIRLDDIEPRVVRRGDTVTIIGKDLYGVKDVRVGGAPAPIVKRGQDDEGELETLQSFIPESARNGLVRVNGERVAELDLELIEDDDWKAS